MIALVTDLKRRMQKVGTSSASKSQAHQHQS